MLTPADVRWRNGHPYAAAYQDIYYTGDGVDEVERVLVRPSRVAQRLATQPEIVIGELGFGTGLNFACCANLCAQVPDARMHFISFEKHPLAADDWLRIAQDRESTFPCFREFRPLPLLPGWHRRWFADGRVTLSVYFGAASVGLAQLAEQQQRTVDAWFLDGFAPSKNADMWTDTLFSHIASLSHHGTTVATFSAAGAVRRGLQQTGFRMSKVDQQPVKRESLAGVFDRSARKTGFSKPKTVTVFGAGIAGCSVARLLADQQVNVVLCDPHGVAAGASRMRATVLHGRLLGDASASAAFRASAYHFSASYVRRFDGFQRTGVLQLQGPNLNREKLERILAAYPHANDWLQRCSSGAATRLAGVNIGADALWFPDGGIVDLPALCRNLARHPRIERVHEAAVEPPYVIAAGARSRSFPGCDNLEIAEVYGQLDQITSDHMPKIPIVGNGYAVPAETGCVIGATYEHTQWTAADASAHNIVLNRHLFDDDTMTSTSHQRAGRAIASDRHPVVGQLGEGIWITTAHGSLGTVSAPFSAALIASDILGWIAPGSQQAVDVLSPARFAARQARRGIRHISQRSPER